MKKILAVFVIFSLVLCTLTACSGKKAAGDSTEYNMKDVVTAIEKTAPVASPLELSSSIEGSESYMTDLFGLDMADVEDYYGKMSMINVKSDVILMVKAASGKTDAVKASLEQRRNALAASFEMYLSSEYDKATSGRVIVKGDYVLLVIAGDSDRIAEGDVDAVYAEIDKAIDAALQ